MAVKCDVARHMVKRGTKEEGILEERFQGCPNERVIIVATEQGRAGLCAEHLAEYNEYRQANAGKPSKDLKPWARLRHGKVIMGEEVPIPEGG